MPAAQPVIVAPTAGRCASCDARDAQRALCDHCAATLARATAYLDLAANWDCRRRRDPRQARSAGAAGLVRVLLGSPRNGLHQPGSAPESAVSAVKAVSGPAELNGTWVQLAGVAAAVRPG